MATTATLPRPQSSSARPKSAGRSRFSKTLPSVPSFFFRSRSSSSSLFPSPPSQLPMPPLPSLPPAVPAKLVKQQSSTMSIKDLPDLPPLPPPPPLKMDGFRAVSGSSPSSSPASPASTSGALPSSPSWPLKQQHLDSPLPPLPVSIGQQLVPRRPVGTKGPPQPFPRMATQQRQQQQQPILSASPSTTPSPQQQPSILSQQQRQQLQQQLYQSESIPARKPTPPQQPPLTSPLPPTPRKASSILSLMPSIAPVSASHSSPTPADSRRQSPVDSTISIISAYTRSSDKEDALDGLGQVRTVGGNTYIVDSKDVQDNASLSPSQSVPKYGAHPTLRLDLPALPADESPAHQAASYPAIMRSSAAGTPASAFYPAPSPAPSRSLPPLPASATASAASPPSHQQALYKELPAASPLSTQFDLRPEPPGTGLTSPKPSPTSPSLWDTRSLKQDAPHLDIASSHGATGESMAGEAVELGSAQARQRQPRSQDLPQPPVTPPQSQSIQTKKQQAPTPQPAPRLQPLQTSQSSVSSVSSMLSQSVASSLPQNPRQRTSPLSLATTPQPSQPPTQQQESQQPPPQPPQQQQRQQQQQQQQQQPQQPSDAPRSERTIIGLPGRNIRPSPSSPRDAASSKQDDKNKDVKEKDESVLGRKVTNLAAKFLRRHSRTASVDAVEASPSQPPPQPLSQPESQLPEPIQQKSKQPSPPPQDVPEPRELHTVRSMPDIKQPQPQRQQPPPPLPVQDGFFSLTHDPYPDRPGTSSTMPPVPGQTGRSHTPNQQPPQLPWRGQPPLQQYQQQQQQQRFPPRSASRSSTASRQPMPRLLSPGVGAQWQPQGLALPGPPQGWIPYPGGPPPFRTGSVPPFTPPRTYRHGDYEDRIDAFVPSEQPREPVRYRFVNQDDLPDPDPQALHFPRSSPSSETAAAAAAAAADNTAASPSETVPITPRPVGARHMACYARHALLREVPNRNYPLKCQTCLVTDAEPRWSCAWCSLRICRACVDLLDECGRNLAAVVDRLAAYDDLALKTVRE